MSGLLRALRQALGFSKAGKSQVSTQGLAARDLTRFAEGDRVLIDGARLTALQKNSSSNFKNGLLLHNDIIGKTLSSHYVRGPKALFKVEPPTLDDYVSLTPRLVTPVYANYASTIVSLLDIHPVPWTEDQSSPSPSLEILEAGTGHGSLTLHVSRAIAAANPPPLTIAIPQMSRDDSKRAPTETEKALTQAWTDWKQTRRAVLHTVEKVEANRWHAEKIVRGFRQGLYWPHVDFYAGDVSGWIQDRLAARRDQGHSWNPLSKPDTDGFLDYVLLDMPGVHTQLKHVHAAMREGAKLIVFTPSVTQIGDCARVIQEASLPLAMERVLELGEGVSNGRRWDVRRVLPRNKNKDSSKIRQASSATAAVEPDLEKQPSDAEEGSESSPAKEATDVLADRLPEDEQDEPVMICRPLVGERTMGGGFIALFRKISPESAALAAQWRRGQTGWAKKHNR
ncbi:hypothetical protein LTR99_001375 [Exophiala xenobiotica]|uniref:tRNA (adenine(58)-N(1))-methyltransferase catalytic subunit TRM61 n=1 Tax=Vermiconidia calcicola TaxID=1690605 RepID=A0AAV9QPM1_9PEZI|nr:hypothetical protein LTR96_003294 [Exophiala xenobiotica]KAK5545937.1 hypothetical protein LTR25_000947 [Vermiconidia calcicola]KAK5549804.1 hypothetical protein LTR23_000095 [Chaetothyriales sp. CCFEE 6169]KAK5308400.1 hypothetical protein LTR99_001375 [Exophiala xenobiotica]KAK5342705.1 hypothetical protein LTR98_000331 [Exophiala xenobiotica]